MPTDQLSPSDAAQGLRTVLDLLLQDLPLTPLDPAVLPWDEPILVLRSADMKKMRAFLDRLVARCPSPALHVLSHARDEAAIRAMVPFALTFHAYPVSGRYRLEEVPRATLDALQAAGIGTAFFLDTGISGDLFDEVERLLSAIAPDRLVSVHEDGTLARTPERRLRKRAESAFLGLIEWYQRKLDPGFPDGPVTPDSGGTVW
jgi:hypothetical protein